MAAPAGSIVGDVVDNGALAFDRSDVSTFAGVISGSRLRFPDRHRHDGLDRRQHLYRRHDDRGGHAAARRWRHLGQHRRRRRDNGALVFDRSDVSTFSGVISGVGAVSQIGTGTTVLTADSTYTGGTSITAGTLAIGDAAHPGAALSGGGAVDIAAVGTLGGYGSVTGTVTNDGTIAVADAVSAFAGAQTATSRSTATSSTMAARRSAGEGIGNRLTVTGDYVGGNGIVALDAERPRTGRLAIGSVGHRWRHGRAEPRAC